MACRSLFFFAAPELTMLAQGGRTIYKEKIFQQTQM